MLIGGLAPTQAFRFSFSAPNLPQQEHFSRMADLALFGPLVEHDYITAHHGTATYALRLRHPAPVGGHRCVRQRLLGMDLTVQDI